MHLQVADTPVVAAAAVVVEAEPAIAGVCAAAADSLVVVSKGA